MRNVSEANHKAKTLYPNTAKDFGPIFGAARHFCSKTCSHLNTRDLKNGQVHTTATKQTSPPTSHLQQTRQELNFQHYSQVQHLNNLSQQSIQF